MKLHEKLRNRNLFPYNFFNDGIFGTFDIHLENVNPAVPLKLHRSRKLNNWKTQRRSPILLSLNHGVRNPAFPQRQIKSFFPAVAGDPHRMKMKLPRQGLRSEPLPDFGSWIESINLHAETLDKRQIERNVLADSHRIDNRAGLDQRIIQPVAAVP